MHIIQNWEKIVTRVQSHFFLVGACLVDFEIEIQKVYMEIFIKAIDISHKSAFQPIYSVVGPTDNARISYWIRICKLTLKQWQNSFHLNLVLRTVLTEYVCTLLNWTKYDRFYHIKQEIICDKSANSLINFTPLYFSDYTENLLIQAIAIRMHCSFRIYSFTSSTNHID